MVVKVNISERACKALGITTNHPVAVAKGGYQMLLQGGKLEYLAGRNAEGQEEGTIMPGQLVSISLPDYGAYAPVRYQFLIHANEALMNYGTVCTSGLLDNSALSTARVVIKADRKIDLKDFDHVFRITALED
jgi:hypothetical protein